MSKVIIIVDNSYNSLFKKCQHSKTGKTVSFEKNLVKKKENHHKNASMWKFLNL